MTVSTQNDHSRLATQWAVALATGGKTPKDKAYPSTLFEDSISGKPSKVQCRTDLPGDVYLSAKMSGDAQAKLKTN
jgi:ribose transport system substrate-binding protein